VHLASFPLDDDVLPFLGLYNFDRCSESFVLVDTFFGNANNSQFLYRIAQQSGSEKDYFVDTFRLNLGKWNYTASLPNFANYDLGPLVGSHCDTLSPQDTTQTGLIHHPPPSENWSVFPSTSTGFSTLQSEQAGWLIVHDL